MDIHNKYYRELRIIKDYVNLLNVNLNELIVVTEVGSNNYIFSPIIPLLSGAKKVYAWTRDSKFGKAKDNINECKAIAQYYNLQDKIVFSTKRDISYIKEADIITNSGFIIISISRSISNG